MTLPDDGIDGAISQLERLKAVRGPRVTDAARLIFIVDPTTVAPPPTPEEVTT